MIKKYTITYFRKPNLREYAPISNRLKIIWRILWGSFMVTCFVMKKINSLNRWKLICGRPMGPMWSICSGTWGRIVILAVPRTSTSWVLIFLRNIGSTRTRTSTSTKSTRTKRPNPSASHTSRASPASTSAQSRKCLRSWTFHLPGRCRTMRPT